jgi:hypothetical protein
MRKTSSPQPLSSPMSVSKQQPQEKFDVPFCPNSPDLIKMRFPNVAMELDRVGRARRVFSIHRDMPSDAVTL